MNIKPSKKSIAAPGRKAKKSKSRKVLSEEEKVKRKTQRDHANLVRGVFQSSGFVGFPGLADKEFSLDPSTTSDFDEVFLYENLLVCVERTVSNRAGIGDHLRKKKIVYERVRQDPLKLISVLSALDSKFANAIKLNYSASEIVIKIVYCSRFDVPHSLKKQISEPIYFDYPELRYFKNLVDCIKHSARPELLAFLQVPVSGIGLGGKISTSFSTKTFEATLLPEVNSNFDPGFKVVTFYADAETLLERSYVLRRQGWRDSENLYQRLVSKSKIDSIRSHLKSKKRVFVNNVIATLDERTKLLDSHDNQVDPSAKMKIEQVKLQLPDIMNSIGLIDGQHRTYSYFVSDPDDQEIAKLRKKQNLLVTGLIYPSGYTPLERESFEARLFLEINSTQTNAKSDLKLAINRIIAPFSDESLAFAVVDRLASGGGPLDGRIARFWYDTEKLKTTSIVSYGMKPLVKTSGNDSLFYSWPEQRKAEMVSKSDSTLRDQYLKYCEDQINKFLTAIRNRMPGLNWTADKSERNHVITATAINGLLITMRYLVRNGKLADTETYEGKLREFTSADFLGFHSSQYGKLAEKIYKKYFSI